MLKSVKNHFLGLVGVEFHRNEKFQKTKVIYFMTHIDFTPFYPRPRPKNDFLMIWAMRYQFRHVRKGALELKPYFHNNEDPWKKNWHFKYWNWPRCNQNSQILAKKSISQYGYLKHSKWAVLRNLSLISIIMRIGEKKLGCHNTKNLRTEYAYEK